MIIAQTRIAADTLAKTIYDDILAIGALHHSSIHEALPAYYDRILDCATSFRLCGVDTAYDQELSYKVHLTKQARMNLIPIIQNLRRDFLKDLREAYGNTVLTAMEVMEFNRKKHWDD